MIGQRIDVRNFRIADEEVDKCGVSAHIFRLADRHCQHDGAIVAGDLDRARLCGVRFANHAEDRCGEGNGQRDHKITQPVALLRGPVRRTPAEAGADMVMLIHDTLPHP